MKKPIKTVLVSVSDKSGLVSFIKELVKMDWRILSTGGTAKLLTESNIPVIKVDEFIGLPEILDGRVKTLHPKIHAGLLYCRDNKAHREQIAQLGYESIDMVIVNLYPFEQISRDINASLEQVIENIDIGGPSMLRSASKNYESVTVIVNPERYNNILAELKSNEGKTRLETRAGLAAEAFAHTAYYDSLIARYFNEKINFNNGYPEKINFGYKKLQDLRYGENPHQSAAFYQYPNTIHPSLAQLNQIQGKELSFNNFYDMDTALECLMEFTVPACVIVKHANPCGVAIGNNALDSYNRAMEADPVSAYGGIVAINSILDENCAEKMSKKFLEVIIAPAITDKAKGIIAAKQDLRVVLTGDWKLGDKPNKLDLRYILGGLLVQSADSILWDEMKLKTVTQSQPTDIMIEELKFAFTVVKYLKSNAIAITNNGVTCGLGMGQTNRVDAAKQAIKRAGDKSKGAVLASDAFFPFSDIVREAANAGISAIIQPGGAKRDQDSIDVCNEHGIVMLFSGIRHFRH